MSVIIRQLENKVIDLYCSLLSSTCLLSALIIRGRLLLIFSWENFKSYRCIVKFKYMFVYLSFFCIID